jgi:hypothetical protein
MSLPRIVLAIMLLDSDEEQEIRTRSPKPRVYRPLTNGWLADFVPSLPDEEFRLRFRGSRTGFQFIESLVVAAVPEQDRRKTRNQLLLCLYFLGHKVTLQELSDLFGIPKTSCWRAISELTKLITGRLAMRVIRLPSVDEMEALAAKFALLRPIQGTILAVDGTHLPIEAPLTCPERYVNRKGWHSVNVQVVVDADCIFRHVYGALPGCSHDAYVYKRSSFSSFVERSIPAQFHVLGDAAYPLRPGLLTPYRGLSLAPHQQGFNRQHSSQRMKVECALGQLKGRFARFRYASRFGEQPAAARLFLVAVVMHNLIKAHRLDTSEDFLLEAADQDVLDMAAGTEEATSDADEPGIPDPRTPGWASQKRDAIARALLGPH